MEQADILKATKFIYAVKSLVFPGLIKIGRTQNMKERLSQLNTACAPSPFVIVVVSPTLDFIRDEKKAHCFFSDHRKKGEFFSITESQVTEFFKTVQEKYDSESKQMTFQAPDISEESARKAQAESVLKMILIGAVKEARDARTSKSDLDQNNQISRKRQLERDDAMFELEMAERKQRLLQTMLVTQQTLMYDYASLCPQQILDDKARLMFKDNLLTLMSLQDVSSVTDVPNVEDVIPDSTLENTERITVRSFALEQGKHYSEKDLQRIEEIMSSMYEKKYGVKASLHQ